ncbi:MAG TPA: cyclopropane-fatty-acyl-phospholipid synthase family protein [Gemmataceae bacterium]|nr:cyclopropane-fatty-acyl-phospholipid synthase family protein [Gemmataceae bacterium]
MATQQLTSDPAVEATRALLQRLTASYTPRDFAVRFWDGSTWEPDPGQPANFTLVLQHPGALRQMFAKGSAMSLGEAYIYDDFDVEGDMRGFVTLQLHLRDQKRSLGELLSLGLALRRLPSTARPRVGRQAAKLQGKRRSLERDREAISYHYDLSNEFFSLWLDRNMVYTGAYFSSRDEDLDTAQERKLDYVCRKLQLRPGERFLDLGCGWGGLVLHAAQHYGVKAAGITLARRQAEWAQERIRAAGLEGRCRVEYRDWREMDEPEGYDKLASICMLEHVGEALMPAFFQNASRLLRPGGLHLNQGITISTHTIVPKGTNFPESYVFPDGELKPVNVTLRAAEGAGFEIRDVECMREHYDLTLQHWLQRLEAHREELIRLTDEVTYRIFRIYLARAGQGYRVRDFNLYQTLLAKTVPGEHVQPLTRSGWYTA